NSPRVCPPMPSATAHSPCADWSRQASSLSSRTRPGWDLEAEVQRNEWVSMLMRSPPGHRVLVTPPRKVLLRAGVAERSEEHCVIGGIVARIGDVDRGGLVDHLADIHVVVGDLLQGVEYLESA